MASASAPNPALLNAQARALVTGNAVKMIQNISSQNVTPGSNPVLNIPLRNVGLILGLLVEVSATVTNGATTTATRTGFGTSNMVKNFTLTDLNNVQRINSSGRHIALLDSARQGFGYGGAYAPNLPMAYGNNWGPFQGPATIAASTDANLKHTYYVPLAYSSADLRGAIYAAVVNATMNLQITLNPTPFVAGTDALDAIYSGNAGGVWKNTVTVNVYQVYLDQLPQSGGGVILPMMDLNTVYDIKQTVQSGLNVGQDFPIPYANFRQFLSTMAIFDNGGSFNSGSDVNYWSLVSANSTNLFKYGPDIAALLARQTFMSDPPPGTYYFDHRDKPIDTITYGNMELVINPSTVNAGAVVVMGYEAFTMSSQIPVSSSLAS
jgi:hypothetical protein